MALTEQEYIDNVKERLGKLSYLDSMLDKMPEASNITIADGKQDRWVGFIQGALWAMNLGEIDQFREDVREGRALEALQEFFRKKE